jgi:hypothetical protein
VKIAICLPAHGVAQAHFTHSLSRMVARTLKERPDLELETITALGTLPRVRNRLFRDAMASGASHALWLDNDHVFPDWALIRLLSLELAVVGINQPTRSLDPIPTARDEAGELIYTTPEQAAAKAVERVRYMGLGICLMDVRALVAALARPVGGRLPKSIFPLFEQRMSPDPDIIVGEDTWFCNRLAEADVPIHIDHFLSWEARHLATVPISMADALAKRDRAESGPGPDSVQETSGEAE